VWHDDLAIGLTWIAGAFAGGLLATRVVSALKVGIVAPAFGDALLSPMMLRAFVIHDLLALVAAVAGASLAVRVERSHARTSTPICRPIAEPG
jgi:hypothetical protein